MVDNDRMKIDEALIEIISHTSPHTLIPIIIVTYGRLSLDEIERLKQASPSGYGWYEITNIFIKVSVVAKDIKEIAKLPFVKSVNYDAIATVV